VQEQKLLQDFTISYITDTTTKNCVTQPRILPVRSESQVKRMFQVYKLKCYHTEYSTEEYSKLYITISNSHYPVWFH